MSTEEPKPGKKRASGPPNVMADLLSKSKVADATPCPNCKSYMTGESVICTHCGYNSQTGKNINTRVIDAPKQKKAKAQRGSSFNFDPMLTVWAMALFYGAMSVGIFLLPDLFIALVLIVAVAGLIVGITVLVTTFLDGDILWGVVMLIPVINIASIYYILALYQRPVLKAHWILAVCANILVAVLATSYGPDVAETAKAVSAVFFSHLA